MARGLHRDPRDRRNTCSPRKFSWLRSGTSYESGIKEAQYFYTCFPEDRNCEVCKRPKITRVPCRRRTGKTVLRAEKFCDLSYHSRSQSPQRRMWILRSLLIFSCGTRFSHSTDSILSVQNKNFSGDGNEFTEISQARKSFTLTIPWNLANPVKNIMESSYFHTLSIWDERDCRKSSAQNDGRNICSIVLRSGLDEKWLADSMECYCYLRNV